jgi:hypothetical protein
MKRRNHDSELLREGYRSYPKALFAVMEFRREAATIIEAAVNKRVPELAAAMKMSTDELRDEICHYTSPSKLTQSYDGSATHLGVWFPRDLKSKWRLEFYLWMEDGEKPCFYGRVVFKDPGSAIERLAASCKGLAYDETCAWISETVPADGPRDLDAVCDRVLNRWIALWKKVGGLRQFTSKRG